MLRYRVSWCLAIVFILMGCTPQKSSLPLRDQILEQIKTPVIAQTTILLTDFGAIADSTFDSKPAFDKAIAHLASVGGGTLTVPAGTYLINGPIHFISNFCLNLEKGAKIKFGSEYGEYLPVVRTSWEGTELYNYSPFIYAYQCENIAITGHGTIDGEASETWSKWHGIQKDDQMRSRQMNHADTPIDERIFGDGHFLRPHLVQFFECRNILIEGVRLEDSPFWCIHLFKCNNATLRKLSYDAQNKNNDGIDPEYSQNILIEDIDFNNADDNVAIKAGRDYEGRRTNRPSQNIIIRNCRFKGLHAVVIGSEMSSGVQNVFVENCTNGGYLKRGIYLKSNPDRGGFIKNIFVENVAFGKVEDCFYITSFYHNQGEGFVTDISDIHFKNISCQHAWANGIVIQGFSSQKVRDIYFSNITIDTVGNALSLTDTENIVFSDVIMGSKAGAPSSVK